MMRVSGDSKRRSLIWRGPYTLILLLAVGSDVTAQRAGHFAPRAHTQAANPALNQSAHRGFRGSSPYASLPFPFFSDIFDSGDIYSTGYPVASQPPPFLMEAARDMAGPTTDSMATAMRQSPARESSGTQPLMIELQNGRYVHVSNAAIDGEALPLDLSARNVAAVKLSEKRSNGDRTIASDHTLLPTVLIFRDGHSEEVREYTITDGALYARGDLYTDGYWNKKIALAALDLPQTLQANANRNVKFLLPSSANEVIANF
ncbi:MAG: hypothetical protein ACLQLC_17250 [Candidatus Sulfotelmatobacter sp.]